MKRQVLFSCDLIEMFIHTARPSLVIGKRVLLVYHNCTFNFHHIGITCMCKEADFIICDSAFILIVINQVCLPHKEHNPFNCLLIRHIIYQEGYILDDCLLWICFRKDNESKKHIDTFITIYLSIHYHISAIRTTLFYNMYDLARM